MIEHDSHERQAWIPVFRGLCPWLCHAIGVCFVLLVLCPLMQAQTNDQATPASATEVKLLRDEVQNLLARVEVLEKQLKQRQPVSDEKSRDECHQDGRDHAEGHIGRGWPHRANRTI